MVQYIYIILPAFLCLEPRRSLLIVSYVAGEASPETRSYHVHRSMLDAMRMALPHVDDRDDYPFCQRLDWGAHGFDFAEARFWFLSFTNT